MANNEVDVDFSFLRADLPFRNLSINNPHGWGIGYYKNDIALVKKEPIPAFESKNFPELIRSIKSNIFISHVRKSTEGAKTSENTHPFINENWIFAHNGTIDIMDKIKEQLLPKYVNNIKGETDSELFFFLLLQLIDQNDDIIKGVRESIRFIEKNRGSNTTSLNFLLTNGIEIYTFRKAFCNPDYYSLYYLNRDPKNNDELNYLSEETSLLIHSKRLSGEKSIIICSEKLTLDEEWIPIDDGTLIIIDNNMKINKESI